MFTAEASHAKRLGDRRSPGRVRAGLMALTLALICPLTVSAADGDLKTLVGTWHLTADLFPGHAMITFFSDGTLIHTAASKNNVNDHGVWKKLGPLRFVEQNREYVYENEELVLFADTTDVIELAEDGMSFVSQASTDLKLLDGTVIDTVEFTVFGERMVIDFEE